MPDFDVMLLIAVVAYVIGDVMLSRGIARNRRRGGAKNGGAVWEGAEQFAQRMRIA